jgi:hypothetical protein
LDLICLRLKLNQNQGAQNLPDEGISASFHGRMSGLSLTGRPTMQLTGA